WQSTAFARQGLGVRVPSSPQRCFRRSVAYSRPHHTTADVAQKPFRAISVLPVCRRSWKFTGWTPDFARALSQTFRKFWGTDVTTVRTDEDPAGFPGLGVFGQVVLQLVQQLDRDRDGTPTGRCAPTLEGQCPVVELRLVLDHGHKAGRQIDAASRQRGQLTDAQAREGPEVRQHPEARGECPDDTQNCLAG